jgi:uncharacterized protein YecT (DUF1311 family)
MMARYVVLLLALALGGCRCGASRPTSIDDLAQGMPVEFVRAGDPRHMELIHSDGSRVDVSYWASDDDLVLGWHYEGERTGKRRPMTVNYTLAKGIFLKDNLTGKEVRLKGVVSPHPIDKAVRDWEKEHGTSTASMLTVDQMTTEAWKAEINRTYQQLGGDDNPRLKAAHQAWLAYREAQLDFLAKYYGDRDGSMWPLVHSGHILSLTRRHAEYMQSVADW